MNKEEDIGGLEQSGKEREKRMMKDGRRNQGDRKSDGEEVREECERRMMLMERQA